MQDEKKGVQIRTVKTFMTKIPSVFTGTDLINWLLTNLDLSDCQEALSLANRMASFGYFFPIDDHVLTVKNDNTYYRFQVKNNVFIQIHSRWLQSKKIYYLRMSICKGKPSLFKKDEPS